MANSQHKKPKKLDESLSKAETECKMYQQQLLEAADNTQRKERVRRLVKSCEEAMTMAFGKHEELYSFADKTTHPEAWKSDLQSWLSDVTVKNDEVLKKAREYIDGLPETAVTSQDSAKNASQAKSASQTSKTSTSRISKTSSQR